MKEKYIKEENGTVKNMVIMKMKYMKLNMEKDIEKKVMRCSENYNLKVNI